MIHEACGSIYLIDDFSEFAHLSNPQERTSPVQAPRRSKVLVVDDQRLIVDTLCEILESEGFDVVAAYDGWQAIDVAARFRPDHLLTDVLMPRMNGVELAIAMRRMYPSVNILLFTGQSGISDILEDAAKRGFHFEVIAKPVHPSKLVEALKKGP